jgi:hypothetical protein
MASSTARFALCLLAALALTPGRAFAARVLLVSDAGADLDIAPVLTADGHQVVVVSGDFASGNATLRSDLSGYDVVVWSATGNGYGDEHTDSSVFANLADFVQRGGRVLVTGYDTVASPTDSQLIQLLGATGSTDVPAAPGPVTMEITSLTFGLVDIRGIVPSPMSGDRDTLTGLYGDTIEVVGTSGGGGSQWTLRRLGDGEIAYVSNGDAGPSSTPSWSTTSSDGTGVYNAALRNFAAASGRGSSAMREVATHGSPRRAHTMYLLDAPSPAVLVGPDRAWIPPGAAVPLSICGPACHPIRETRECLVPECPGQGTLLIASERIADVSDFPRDRDGWNRERATLMADAELAPLAWAFGVHPEPPPAPPRPARFLRASDERLGWELHAEGGIGVLANSGVAVGTISASLGFRMQPSDLDLEVMYGNILGADLRATVLPAMTGQRPEDVGVLVGISPAFAYAFPHDLVRIPPAFAFLIPELGLAISTMHPITYYVAWHVEAATLLDDHVGLDVRADAFIIDEWVDGDAVEALVSLSAGLFFR